MTQQNNAAEEALPLAIQYGCSAHDAAYIALAARFSVPFVTADETLMRKLGKPEFDLRFLGDWPVV